MIASMVSPSDPADVPGLTAPATRWWRWPWRQTVGVLGQRFREDRLGLTAGSLTFTTLISLVPLFTVALALFSAFPVFSSFQGALERLLLQNLVPDAISRPVMASLTQFASKASRLGALGLGVLAVTALALVLTIDRTLNALWRVRRPRPLAQRLLVYWAVLTLGPLLLGASLTLTWWVLSASRGLVSALPGGLGVVVDVLQFALLALAATMLFRFVPNTEVRWVHAGMGGVFVAAGVEGAKQALAWYVATVPTINSVYGAFAIVPILLVWIYLLWVVVLLGAVVAAYAPVLSMRLEPRAAGPGDRFGLALDLLRLLEACRHTPMHGMTAMETARRLRVDVLEAEPLLDLLVEIGWAGRLDEAGTGRYVLLADPSLTNAAPLLDRLLVMPSASTAAFRRRAQVETLRLAELIG